MIVDDAAVQVISAARPEWIHPFTGLTPVQFRRLVRLVAQRGGAAIADGRPGRQWALDLSDRGLTVADQPHDAPDRAAVRRLALSCASGHRYPRATARVDTCGSPPGGSGDHRGRDSRPDPRPPAGRTVQELPVLDLQVAIDANTRLVVALGDPQPGNRNDTIVYRCSGINRKLAGRPTMADGAYRGNTEVIIPYRKPADGTALAQWKGKPQRRAPQGPGQGRAHPGPDEAVEDLA
jgi:hypothetical protein